MTCGNGRPHGSRTERRNRTTLESRPEGAQNDLHVTRGVGGRQSECVVRASRSAMCPAVAVTAFEAMAVFYSFHYGRDAWRVQQVVQMGAVEGQRILNSQDWQHVTRRGDQAIRDWIAQQMAYKSAVVALVGAETASRHWVRFEITIAWDVGRPLVGIRINRLTDREGWTDPPGPNRFARVPLQSGGTVADHVPLHDPQGQNSQQANGIISTLVWLIRSTDWEPSDPTACCSRVVVLSRT